MDALGGEPGVYSARYGGEGLDDNGRMMLLLENMKNIPDGERSARFVCVITMVSDEGSFSVRGECEGEIARESAGENGFGYDPIFLVEGTDRTMAELSEEEKNEISHRGRALKEVIKYLKTV